MSDTPPMPNAEYILEVLKESARAQKEMQAALNTLSVQVAELKMELKLKPSCPDPGRCRVLSEELARTGGTVDKMREDFEDSLVAIKEAHEEAMKALRTEHAEAVKALRAEHEETVKALREEHVKGLGELQTDVRTHETLIAEARGGWKLLCVIAGVLIFLFETLRWWLDRKAGT